MSSGQAAIATQFATDDDEAMLPAPLGAAVRRRDFLNPMMNLNDKTVLVTGGTGSFGKQFVKLIAQRFKPRRLIVFSRDELKQYEMAAEFPQDRFPFMRYFIGDIRNRDRLELALRDVDYVVHAAAMKHVPIAEYNPFECIATNVIGAENVVQSALRRGVKRVIALSTDKAANPVNLYGASKLASDKIFVAANNLSGADGCRFAVVRYGNVVGSRGSVLPHFQRLMQERADALPITDERMTRFWITLTQGVNFVLSSMAMMRGGEIFVPKIPSMRMTELASSIAPHMAQKIVGVRPGEKLHEIMITGDDARQTVEFDDRYVILPSFFQNMRGDYLAAGARAVTEDFCYASDNNPERLDARALQSMLEEAFA
jgi:UDP-N-acetylglucosamine 4,6-dehydratase/5-epimerase